MSDSVTIENSDGESFAEVIDIIGVSEIKKSFQQSVKEGSLHKWFKGSKSKDGKPGWVNVVTGGTCASDEKGEGTPKCVSASKRASMTKAERLSAARRKKKADPGQQAKTGAAKPTYVSTDSPRKKKMKESYGGTGVSRKARLASTHPPTAQAAIKNIPTETDRGSGNKAKRRAGMPVEKKSPTYKAYVANKKSDNMSESHYGKSVNKIPKELDKSVALHSSQAKRLRASNEFKKDAGKAANKIPGQLDKAVAMHAKQAKTLRAAGVKETFSNWREEVKRDEYGDIVGGPKISKKQKAKNLASSVEYFDLPLEVEIPHTDATFRLGLMFRESLDVDKGMLFIFEEVGQHSFHMKNTSIPLDIAFVREDGIVESIKELTPFSNLPVYSDGEVLFAIEANRGWFAENNVEIGDEIVLGEAKDKKGKGSGTKDACYHKVKSRYSVWPSAYASGALVKCRKVGAANWGNKSESVEMKNYLDKKAKKLDKQRSAQPDRYKNNPAFDSTSPDSKDPAVARSRAKYEEYNLEEAKKKKKAQKCWPGYEKKGTKMMFGKRYNNCVKKEEFSNWREEVGYEGKDDSKKIEEAKSPAWQRKEGKSESGGLNKKGVASYRAANPGSKLKTAVTTKPSKLKKGSKAAKRRKSFCARMKGMKKRLTSAKTARDPDSRINKSLRKWNC